MKQLLIISLFFLSTVFSVFPQESLKHQVMLPFEITQYKIDVVIPESYDRIDVKAKINIKELFPADTLKITLCNGFKGTLASDISVLDKQDKPIPFINDSVLLQIILPENYLKENKYITIKYNLVKDKKYAGDKYENFAREISDTLCHINAGITRTDNWYPHIAGSYPKRLPPFELNFTTPENFELVASGHLTDEMAKGNKRITKWVNYPEITDRSLFFYAVKGYKKITRSFPDFKIHMYVPSNAKLVDTNINYTVNLIYRAYRFFEECYGKVPDDEFKILFSSFWQSTSNYTSGLNFCGAPLSYLSGEIKTDDIGYPYRTLIHEISHTWWGNVVAFPSDSDYWLFESFAKYSEIIAVPKLLNINNETALFQRVKLACLPYLDYTRSISESGLEQNRHLQIVSSYYQGSTLLYFLKYIMGESDFYNGLKDYVTSNKNKMVTTSGFISKMQKHTNIDIAELLKDYIYKPGYAEYSVIKTDVEETDKYVKHSYSIKNAGNKQIITDLYIKSDIDSINRRLNLAPGDKEELSVRSSKENEKINLIINKNMAFPLKEVGTYGAGGCAFPNNNGKVVIWDVVENTPLSNAGISTGTELLAINSEPVTGKSFEEITNLLMCEKGDKCTLKIKNKKGITEVTLEY